MSNKDDYQEYKSTLNELKINSKPLINVLTILAEEKISNAPQVVRAIEERIVETKGEAVLHVLYVLDSIVKNLRSLVYRQLFEPKLAGLFAGAFAKVDERTRLAMFKLRQTWTPYFSSACLHSLDTKTKNIDPAWPITARPTDSVVSTTVNSNQNLSTIQTTSEENDRSVNRTREENYHMIPIDRQRADVEHSIEKLGQNESNSKQKPIVIKKEPGQVTSTSNDEKKTTKIADKIEQKPVSFTLAPIVDNEVDNLFSGRDVDYRDTEIPTQTKSNSTNVDPDSIFELNNKCLSLAEEKYKSKELSTEEFQATLKLIQAILQNEAQRLTSTNAQTSSFVSNSNHSSNLSTSNSLRSLGSNPSGNPFPSQPFVQFPPNAPSTASTSHFSLNSFANETQRHAMQILSLAGATVPYLSQYNFLPCLPPLPPVPSSFPLISNSFQPQTSQTTTTGMGNSSSHLTTSGSSQNLFAGRHSPSKKRGYDDNSNEHKPNGDGGKRLRDDNSMAHFDDESVAPVPSLVDANINTLKKKYQGVIQQLYIGKNQCHWCGLRFTIKQKDEYKSHLDWHFRENKQVSEAVARSQLSRKWYPSLAEWTVYEEDSNKEFLIQPTNQKQKRTNNDNDSEMLSSTCYSSEVISCPAKNNDNFDDDRCFVCHDPFESFYDDHREEWHLKDAIRVNEKIYHPICYDDSKHYRIHEKEKNSSEKPSSTVSEMIEDSSNSQQADSQFVETAMATAKIKSEYEDSFQDQDSTSDKSSKPNFLSSISFVNLIDTIYGKKEDLKPIENLENVSTTNREEIVDSTGISEEIPFLSIKRETEY